MSEDPSSSAKPSRLAAEPEAPPAFFHRLGLAAKLYVLLLVAALPLCVVTCYLAASGWTSSRAMAGDFPAFVLAVKRDAQFKIFIDGVSDAVDTGTLSRKAAQAAEESRQLTLQLNHLTGTPTPELEADLGLLLRSLAGSRTLAALLPLREEIQRSSKAIVASAEQHHQRLDEIVAQSIHTSTRDSTIALAALLLSLSVAYWVGGRLIQHILRVERRAHEASALNQAIMDAAPIGMMTIGADSLIATANRACHVMHGFEPDALIGRHADCLVDADADDPLRLPPIAGGATIESEWTCVRHDGSRFAAGVIALPLHDARGCSLGELRMVTDITERKRAAARIEHMALHDSLTGLPNRLMLQSRAAQIHARAQRDSGSFALALVDLDRFKQINDTLGHGVGDEVLKIVAQRLKDAVRSSDTIVRMGGDEFALLLPDVQHAAQACEVGQKVLAEVSKVLVVGGQQLHVSASVGVAVYPTHGTDLVTLIRNADAAMYDAKSRGADAVALYEERMSKATDDLSLRRAELREALGRGEFVLHYQPLVDARSGRVLALEALLRWQHPTRGLVGPCDFIPLAEETGLIIPIGAWVLRQACADLAALRRQGHPGLRMAVNVSCRQFADDGLQATIAQALAAAGLEGSALELEITETVLMSSLTRTKSILASLRAMDVRIAIDDFGTGYSSLSYLSHFPVQTVKVDRSFVAQIDSGEGAALLAGAIVALAHSLGLEVVAEGVETAGQQQHLVRLGCELLQGFHFSAAVPVEQLPAAFDRLAALGAGTPSTAWANTCIDEWPATLH